MTHLGRGARVGCVVVAVLCGASPGRAEEPGRVEWSTDWPRFRPAEVALTTGFAAMAAAAMFLFPEPDANWTGGILFDDAVRDGVRLRGRDAREGAGLASDAIYYTLLAYPLLVDVPIVTLGIHDASDVALEMLLMDLEAYSITGAVALTAEKLGRSRPMARECARNPDYDEKCGDDAQLNSSFLSGHTTIAFAGAGLVCVHHQHLPLYGGVADGIVCATGLAAATTAGALRVMSDNHYTSDVLLGALVGLSGGYLLPSVLHYGLWSTGRAPHGVLPRLRLHAGGVGISAVMAPIVAPGYAGLSLLGVVD